jgi:hypothetical protein
MARPQFTQITHHAVLEVHAQPTIYSFIWDSETMSLVTEVCGVRNMP